MFPTKPLMLALSLGLATLSAQAQAPISLSYLGQQILPTSTQYAGTTVGGLSGIDYDAASGRYFAISDDRSGLNPARFYTLGLDLSQFRRSATPGMAGVQLQSVVTLQRPEGGAFALNTVDPEGLRYHAATGSLFWSNEGQRSGAGFQNPTVREMRLDGSHVRDLQVPEAFKPSGSSAGTAPGDRGIYNNLAFESLTLSTDGKTLYTATENALAQDGPQASLSKGSVARIVGFDLASGAASAQYAYAVSPVVLPPVAGGFATNGLTDLLAVGDRQFIAIERSFSAGAVTPGTPVTGNTIRLYHVDARQATDISGLSSLDGASFNPAQKTLLLDLSTLKNDDGSFLATDNIEGLTLGPEINGKRSLILVSDNNFSATQFTQFIALEVSAVPEPGSWALMAAGLALLGGLLRGRRREGQRAVQPA